MTDGFASGSVVSYPYLWRWQHDEGRENAEKDRPVCLAIKLRDEARGITHLVILAISGTPPREGQAALEIPPLEIRRAGLSAFKRGWVTVSEYNYDIVERSYHFEPNQKPRGVFGPVSWRTSGGPFVRRSQRGRPASIARCEQSGAKCDFSGSHFAPDSQEETRLSDPNRSENAIARKWAVARRRPVFLSAAAAR